MDRHCNRHFFALEDTRLFDIDDPTSVSVPDLASVTEILEDRDGDRVFEIERTVADYPLNASPGSVTGRPYGQIRSDVGVESTGFAVGRSRLSVEGRWGYRFHIADSGSAISIGGGISASATVVPVDAVVEIQTGMTIVLDSEQMFARLINGRNLTVKRGVNGSTAAAHADAVTVSFVVIPAQVAEATALLAARFWKSKDATSAGITGAGGFGSIRVRSGFDVEIEALLGPLRKLAIGVGV